MSRFPLAAIILFFSLHTLAQPSLQVVLQKAHDRNYFSGGQPPFILAISPDNQWVASYSEKEFRLVIWNLLAGKIYGNFDFREKVSSATFLGNNNELLINKSTIFNIHTGLKKEINKPVSSGTKNWKVTYGFSFDRNASTTRVLFSGNANTFEDSLREQFPLFAVDSISGRFWASKNGTLYEYDLQSGNVRHFETGNSKISFIRWDSISRSLIVQTPGPSYVVREKLSESIVPLGEAIVNLTISPDGNWVAGADLAGENPVLRIWRISSGKASLYYSLKNSGKFTGYFALFNDNDEAILFTRRTEGYTEWQRAKLLKIPSRTISWEDNSDATEYSPSGRCRYMVATYADSTSLIDLFQKTRVNITGKKIRELKISPDEQLLLAGTVNDNGDYGHSIYKLSNMSALYADFGDTVQAKFRKYKYFPHPSFLFKPHGNDLLLYGVNKLVFSFSPEKNEWVYDSLPAAPSPIVRMTYSEDNQFLVAQCSDVDGYSVFNASTFEPLVRTDSLSEVVTFSADHGSRIFTLYKKETAIHLFSQVHLNGNTSAPLLIGGYLKAINTDSSGMKLAYLVSRTHKQPDPDGYERHVTKHELHILRTDDWSVIDSIVLPDQVSNESRAFQVIFNRAGTGLFIGCKGLFTYDLPTRELTPIPVSVPGYYYPVMDNPAGTRLLCYQTDADRKASSVYTVEVQSGKATRVSASRLYPYLFDGVKDQALKDRPAIFNIERDYKAYYINTAEADMNLHGPLNSKLFDPVITPDGRKILELSTVSGLSITDAGTQLPLNSIKPYRYSFVSFTANNKYAFIPHGYAGSLFSVYDVSKGFRKIPFLFSDGPNTPLYFYNNYNVWNEQQIRLSNNGKYLFTLDSRGEQAVRVFEFATGNLVYEDKGKHLAAVKNPHYEPGGLSDEFNPLVTIQMSGNEEVLVYETARSFLTRVNIGTKSKQRLHISNGSWMGLFQSASGNYTAAIISHYDGKNYTDSLVLWDSSAARKAIPLGITPVNELGIRTIEILEDMNLLLLAGKDRIVSYGISDLRAEKDIIEPLLSAYEITGDVLTLTRTDNQRRSFRLPGLEPTAASLSMKKYSISFKDGLQTITKDQVEIASFLFDDTNEELLFFTPSGYYAIHKASKDAVAFKYAEKLYPSSVFDVSFNRPDTVFRILQPVFNIDESWLNIYRDAWSIRQQRQGYSTTELSGLRNLPQVSIETNGHPILTRDKFVTCTVSASTVNSLGSVNILINGIPYFGHKGYRFEGASYKQKIAIPLTPGRNLVQCVATTTDGISSLPAETVLYYEPADKLRPKTHFIGIGVSDYQNKEYKLNYAAKDVRDFVKVLKTHIGDIIIDTLLDEAVTREKVGTLKTNLMQLQPEDRVILLFCGHGVRDSANRYFLGTYDIAMENPGEKGLPIEAIYDLLDSIPPRNRIMFLDACNSGEYYMNTEDSSTGIYGTKPDPNVRIKDGGRGFIVKSKNNHLIADVMDDVFADFNNRYGIDVIAATKGTDLAYETAALQNGVFTYALMHILKSFPAKETEERGTPYISDIKQSVAQMVFKLTAGKQRPVLRNENLHVDWKLW